MNRLIAGGVAVGIMGGGLALYGNHKIQEVVEMKKKTPIPAVVPIVRAACLVGPNGMPCDGREISAKKQSGVSGTVMFEDDGNECKISYTVSGLTPGMHGFHIHEKADFSKGCISAGPHYNPHKVTHGGQDDDEKCRHVGDLGNITADENGIAQGSLTDKLVKLTGEYSVLGRSVMIHADKDDLGKGGHELSSTTGNAGARVACGEIRKLKQIS